MAQVLGECGNPMSEKEETFYPHNLFYTTEFLLVGTNQLDTTIR
jgi:hypothetical protein